MHLMMITFLLAGFVQAQMNYGNSANTQGFLNPVVHPSQGGEAICITGLVPVYAETSMNLKLNSSLPTNQSMLVQSFTSTVSVGIGQMEMEAVDGPQSHVAGTWNISSTLCYPNSGLDDSSIQFLTHGIVANAQYWDFAPGYSYVDVAAIHGAATFFYDRLGVGRSSKPDAIQVVQAPLEISIAHALIERLRNGTFAGTSFRNVVGTGHSFGSFLSVGVAAQHPTDFDTIVLTGFSANMSGVPIFLSAAGFEIAAENNPTRFGTLSKGYICSGNVNNLQSNFFHYPDFDPAILWLAEATKGEISLGEIFTMTLPTSKPATEYTGPLFIVNGQFDIPMCYGNCLAPNGDLGRDVKPKLFPSASNASSTYIALGAAHGINFHYSATDTFERIQAFIQDVM